MASPKGVNSGQLIYYLHKIDVFERVAQAMRDGGLGSYKVERLLNPLDEEGRPLEGEARLVIFGPGDTLDQFWQIANQAVGEYEVSMWDGDPNVVRWVNTDRVIREQIAALRPGSERK